MNAAAEPLKELVGQAADALIPCRRLLVLAGAGASADSGIPTFRDDGGLWRTHRPEALASAAGFADHPQAVWDWYRERRLAIAAAVPHAGQRALALLRGFFPAAEVLVATTNEDDLLERAGVDPVLHLHGSIFETACVAGCGWRAWDRDSALSVATCPRCSAAVRPGSVWYGEPLPSEPLSVLAAFNADCCLVIGSSCEVAPVSQIPIDLALAGSPVVEINPRDTPLSAHAISLRGTAAVVLPRLVDLLTSSTVRDQRLRHD